MTEMPFMSGCASTRCVPSIAYFIGVAVYEAEPSSVFPASEVEGFESVFGDQQMEQLRQIGVRRK
jgi:hypothetical protein